MQVQPPRATNGHPDFTVLADNSLPTRDPQALSPPPSQGRRGAEPPPKEGIRSLRSPKCATARGIRLRP